MEGRSVQGTDLGVRGRGPSVYSLLAAPDLMLSVTIMPITVADACGLRYQFERPHLNTLQPLGRLAAREVPEGFGWGGASAGDCRALVG